MFTGIVTHQGTVQRISGGTDLELEIVPGFDLGDLALGASVAHAGICLTVTGLEARSYTVQATAETVARTTIGDWGVGHKVNLERSLRLGDELGGHLVFGHVDGVASLRRVEKVGDSRRMILDIPLELAPMLAVKGSVAVDGVSLTVTEADHGSFAVVIIPHSWGVTTLAECRPGDRMNIEVDMLARYVARQLAHQQWNGSHAG
jgi:riboflavin synthase